MKKTLLTGIAALFLATETAHAAYADQLPKEFLGKYCGEEPRTLLKKAAE